MMRIFEYYGRYQGFRARWTGLPAVARLVLFLLALPGLILMVLSILALGVSILALLLLTVPVYRLMMAVTGGSRPRQAEEQPPEGMVSPGRRRVDVKIISEAEADCSGVRPVDGSEAPERT
jgi:hypothetical protein